MKNARWVRLADDLTRGITNGDYPLDSYLPTEMELCEKYTLVGIPSDSHLQTSHAWA